jgi:gas vesicle protein
MRRHFLIAASVAAVLSLPVVAQAQGIVRGAQEGAAEGNRAAGPVGSAVGGAVGGIVGGVEGVLGIPQRSGSASASNRSNRVELSANQISNEFAARAARIKADLRLTPEQEKNWPGFESAMNDMGKRYGDRQTAVDADRTQQKAPVDIIEQLRDEAQFLSDRSVDRKMLADAAQPLYASLDDQQKRRFTKELFDVSRWPAP